MNRATIRICAILSSLMFFAYAGITLINTLFYLLGNTLQVIDFHLSLPATLSIPFAVFLPACVLLINAIYQVRKKQGVRALIFSILTLLVSGVWAIYLALSWAALYAQSFVFEVLNLTAAAQGLFSLMLGTFSAVIEIFILLILLIVILLSILTSKTKGLQFKAQLGALCAVVFYSLDFLFSIVSPIVIAVIGPFLNVSFEWGQQIEYYVGNGLGILAAVLFGGLVLVIGLLTNKDRAPEAPSEQPCQEDVFAN